MDYALKTILNFKGTLYLEGSMVLKTLLISNEKKTRWRSSTKSGEGERRKWFEVSEYYSVLKWNMWALYL